MTVSTIASSQRLTPQSSLANPNLKSDTVLKVKAMAWDEIITKLKEKVPALKDLDDARLDKYM